MLNLNLSSLFDLPPRNVGKKILITASTIATVIIFFKVYRKKKTEQRRLSYPKDVVILHQFPRGLNAPRFLMIEFNFSFVKMSKISFDNKVQALLFLK